MDILTLRVKGQGRRVALSLPLPTFTIGAATDKRDDGRIIVYLVRKMPQDESTLAAFKVHKDAFKKYGLTLKPTSGIANGYFSGGASSRFGVYDVKERTDGSYDIKMSSATDLTRVFGHIRDFPFDASGTDDITPYLETKHRKTVTPDAAVEFLG